MIQVLILNPCIVLYIDDFKLNILNTPMNIHDDIQCEIVCSLIGVVYNTTGLYRVQLDDKR